MHDQNPGWKHMGAHPDRVNEQDGYRFRVYAPHARQVYLMGDFNQWSGKTLPMERRDNGTWELFVPGVARFDSYKYAIRTADGQTPDKADPYAFHAETLPGGASKCCDPEGYPWGDRAWISQQKPHPPAANIYRLHLGSWRRGAEGEFLSYREIARWLVPYVKEMGYTHVRLLPVTEHPLNASPGCHCSGFFAPTSRFGTPEDFMYLVDQLHRSGVGVLMDFPVDRFAPCEFGLSQFDGHPLYEHPGTLLFDLEKPLVRSFLSDAASFWLEVFHLDGLCITGEGDPAEVFARELTAALKETFPNAFFPEALSPAMSFDQISGSGDELFDDLRTRYFHMLTQPGIPQTMMGCEFGQRNGWNCEQSLDWHLLEQAERYPLHHMTQTFFRAANALYLERPVFWQHRFSPVVSDEEDVSLLTGTDHRNHVFFALINHSPQSRTGYRLGVPAPGQYREIFSTDWTQFGGRGRRTSPTHSEPIPRQGMEHSIQIDLPPRSAILLGCSRKHPPKTMKQVME